MGVDVDKKEFEFIINFMLSTQLKSITDLRANPLLISQMASDTGPVYILNRNKPVSILMGVAQYEEMLDLIQDTKDSAKIAELKKTAKFSDFVSHDKLFS
ncbi:MAG: type II toxin-antitoxin system Phd/YefM family antitoxin [Candidatus Magasanikbacteria bacterium]|nr:type II toxin-antitoxin system Phd/YefM family antitoxin [Candidatus Magasanikbacteria bacterium]